MRLGHFFWLNQIAGVERDLKLNEYVSLHTFLVHHRDWGVRVWSNVLFTGPLWDHLVNNFALQLAPLDRVDEQPCLSNEVDVHKWRTLYEHGGQIMDISDTLTMGSFSALYDAADKLQWSYYTETLTDRMANGWICVNRPRTLSSQFVLEAMKHPVPGDRRSWWEEVSSLMPGKLSDCSPTPIPPHIVFGAYLTTMDKWIATGAYELPADCLQLHFYYGNNMKDPITLSRRAKLLRLYEEFNYWRNAEGMLARLYVESLTRAGAMGDPNPLDLLRC